MKKTIKEAVTRPARQPACETIGIDLGDKISRYAVIDQSGEVVQESTFHNTPASIAKHFTRASACIAMEVGSQSAWIARELEQLGHRVIVAHARDLRWITGSDNKNDRNDARKLARLARSDERLLTPVTHRSREQQAELSVIRVRDALMRSRTLLINSCRGVAKSSGCRLAPSITNSFGARSLAMLPEFLQPVLRRMLLEIDAISAAIRDYDTQIAELAGKHEQVQRLTSIPGVGTLTALTFVLTLGSQERFRHSRDVGAYLGLRPRQRQSGERDPRLPISKAGNTYLRTLLVQCAQLTLRRSGVDSALRRWGLAKAGTGRAAVQCAVVAVARKLAVLMHHLWRSGEFFRPFPVAA